MSESDGEAIVIAWEVDAMRCVIGASEGRWRVSIEQDGLLVTRSEFSSAAEAIADAERQRGLFQGVSRQPENGVRRQQKP